MLTMTVEAHARGRLFLGVNRNQHLELERLLDLHHRRELAHASEEGIARRCYRMRQPQPIGDIGRAREPTGAEFRGLLGIADTDELAHPKRLQSIRLVSRLAPE